MKQTVNEAYLQRKENLLPRKDALKAMVKSKSNQFHVSLSERPQKNECGAGEVSRHNQYTFKMESKNQKLKLLKGQLPHEVFIFNKFTQQNNVEELLHHEL